MQSSDSLREVTSDSWSLIKKKKIPQTLSGQAGFRIRQHDQRDSNTEEEDLSRLVSVLNDRILNLLFHKERGDVSVGSKTSLAAYVSPLLHHLSAYVHLTRCHAWIILSLHRGATSLFLDHSGLTVLAFLNHITICIT